jgi:hypothetical protein
VIDLRPIEAICSVTISCSEQPGRLYGFLRGSR